MNDTDQRMRDIAQAVNERVPDGFGFMVMVWPLDDKARYSYATNDQPKAKDILTRAGIGEPGDMQGAALVKQGFPCCMATRQSIRTLRIP